MDIETSRLCWSCKHEQPIDQFFRVKWSSLRQGPCRQCRKKTRDKYRAENPHIVNAHAIYHAALRDGTLQRQSSCSHCGSNRRVCGHHEDYSKPLDVMWLCASCHNYLHSKNELPSPERIAFLKQRTEKRHANSQ